MNKKSYLIMISVFLFIIDCVLIGVLIDVLLKSFPSYVLILFIPVISYCAFYNYYFFKYYFNGVDKIEYSDNELILHFIKSNRKIKYYDIILIKKGFITKRIFIKSKQGNYILHINKYSPLSISDFDYTEMKNKAKGVNFIN